MATSNTRSLLTRMIQNFHLVWLDEKNDDYDSSIPILRQVVNTVNTFVDAQECIQFITKMKDQITFVMVSETLSQINIPDLLNIDHVNSIYIFSQNTTQHETLKNTSPKVKGVFTDIQSICDALKHAAKACDRNSVSISLINSTDSISKDNLNTLNCSFMYTQILKEILLTIDFGQEHIDQFLTCCREELAGNTIRLQEVDKIQRKYRDHQPIWWYTHETLLYSIINRALRLMDVDMIVKMGFFLHDLHCNITELHPNQNVDTGINNSFIVYRGQGLSQSNFEQLKNTQGGLLAFNNFLSTSFDRQTSYAFAESNESNPDLIGVLFEITVDPSISSSPFANIENFSQFQDEKEILFSMHSVFRIGQVTQLDLNGRLWQVELTVTSDNDPQLKELTEAIKKETKGTTGWKRLSLLLILMGEFDKAEELYDISLEQTADQQEKSHLFHHIGMIKDRQGKYAEAVEYCQKSIQIKETLADFNDPDLATSYNNIGGVYYNMGEFPKALEYYDKALEIRRRVLSADNPDLAQTYNNIGLVYVGIGNYEKALEYHQKTFEIYQKTLPSNHPLLATSYNNVGFVYDHLGDYKGALVYYEKALDIFKTILPPKHPSLATSYNNIATMYDGMGEYSKSIIYHEKSLEIFKLTLSENHSSLAVSYNNIGMVYCNTGEYSKALEYFEKSLEINRNALPESHHLLGTSYNNIGMVHFNTGDVSKALECFEKALEIRQKTLSRNDLDTAKSYNNIAVVYNKMGKYSKSLEFDEKALEIWSKTLPLNHPHLAISSNNIGLTYKKMGDYKKALTYYESALSILQESFPADHPTIKTIKENIEIVKEML